MFNLQDFEQYKGLIFDMDGTLINTMPVHEKAWKLVGQTFGYEFDSQLIYQLGGATVHTIAQAMMNKSGMPVERLDDVISKKRQLSYQLVPQESTLLPAFDVVKHYYQQKPMALGSGSHRQLIQLLMDKLAIEHYFNAIVSADDVKAHKPDPETFLRCAELINISPEDCLVFEDADLGVEAGLAAGMTVFDVRTQQFVTR